MRQYFKFYIENDVDVLDNGLETFSKFLSSKMKMNLNNYLTIPSLGYDLLIRECLEHINGLY